MKQTAVEFIAQELSKQIDNNLFMEVTFNKLLDQALEMDKEQIISFGEWYSGMEKEKVERAYQRYLKETFKSE